MTTTRSTSSFHAFAAQLREFIGQCSSHVLGHVGSGDEREFNRLAVELFALQCEYNAPYRKFCESRKISPEKARHWQEIPAMPSAGFKELELTCLTPDHRTTVFHSSGTTAQRPSRHFHSAESLAVYELSLSTSFTAKFIREMGNSDAHEGLLPSMQFLFLTPGHTHARHSSLVHMFETIRRKFGSKNSVFAGHVENDGVWDVDLNLAVDTLREAVAAKRPIFLCGTAFNFVHLLDQLDDTNLLLQLPAGSRVMETGGYKGRSREMSKAELHAWITDLLGVPASYITCEYGMSELSSQAYDGVERGAQADGRTFHFPPWARAQIVSPETGREVAEGETGLIRIFDLANVYSVMAIQTEDLGVRRGNGFELLGRAALSEARGCSLMSI